MKAGLTGVISVVWFVVAVVLAVEGRWEFAALAFALAGLYGHVSELYSQ